MPTPPPSCSLIITTYNWEQALARTLASALAQSRLPDEIIVADDGSREETARLVRRVASYARVPVLHVWQEDVGFRLAMVRNRALGVARGAYVLMQDGDMVMHPEFVRSHLAFARPRQYVQGGRVMLRAAAASRMLAGQLPAVHPFTPGIGNRVNALHLPLLSHLYRGPSGPLERTRGCNMAFWLADAERVNGFNEDFVGWGREDSEFVARLQNAGVRRRNLKYAGIAYHLHHRTRCQERVPQNDAIYERACRHRLTWCQNGLDKYLERETAEVMDGAEAGEMALA